MESNWYIVKYIDEIPIYFTGTFYGEELKPEYSVVVHQGAKYITEEAADFYRKVFGMHSAISEEHQIG